MKWLTSRALSWEWLLALFTILVCVLGVVSTPGFATSFNVQNSLATISEKSLMALPLALLILVREIDISIASTAALSGITLSLATGAGAPLPLAILLCLLTGLVCGAINAILVTVLGMSSLLVTLGTLSLYRGLCYVLIGGQPLPTTDAVIAFGNTAIGGLPIPWVILPFVIAAPVFAFVLHLMPAGRKLYALGGNPETARYSAVRSKRFVFVLFLFSGLFAAVAGIIATGRASSASPASLFGAELDCVTIVFLAGFSFLGGEGRMSGLIWAVLLVASLRSVLLLQGFSGDAQATVIGTILIGSLLLANLSRVVSQRLRARRQRQQLLAHAASPSVHEPA